MNPLKWILGSAVGGLVGAGIWAAVAYFFNVEIGWIAWGVGVLAGLGVRTLAKGEECSQAGVVAALIAVFSIAAGKYAVVEIAMSQIAFADEGPMTAEMNIADIAGEMAQEKTARGEEISWPEPAFDAAGNPPSPEQMFPPLLWAQAKSRWDAMDAKAQEEHSAQAAERMAQARVLAMGVLRGVGFIASFGLFDILWCLLAISSAYRIASEARAA